MMPDDSTEDQLERQFSCYQVDQLRSVNLDDRIDVCWHTLGQGKALDSSEPKYGLLCHVMLSILVIPHSNAHSERIFSSVRKVHVEFRANLGVPMLESLMITKASMQCRDSCHKMTFTNEFLAKAKSATYCAHNDKL